MGVGLIIAAVTIGATVATTLFAKGPRSTKGADMAPANLDAFRLTTAEEGTVIPRVFGTVRLPSLETAITALPAVTSTKGNSCFASPVAAAFTV